MRVLGSFSWSRNGLLPNFEAILFPQGTWRKATPNRHLFDTPTKRWKRLIGTGRQAANKAYRKLSDLSADTQRQFSSQRKTLQCPKPIARAISTQSGLPQCPLTMVMLWRKRVSQNTRILHKKPNGFPVERRLTGEPNEGRACSPRGTRASTGRG